MRLIVLKTAMVRNKFAWKKSTHTHTRKTHISYVDDPVVVLYADSRTKMKINDAKYQKKKEHNQNVTHT